MAVTFLAVGTAAGGTGTVSPGIPTGTTTNDIMILHIEGEGEDADADGQGDFGGTLIGTVANDTAGGPSDTRHTLYWKRAGASESAPTVSDAGQHTLAVITSWRGCLIASSPIHKQQSSFDDTADTSPSFTGVTTTENNCMIVASGSVGKVVTYSSWTNASLASISQAWTGTTVSTAAGSDGSIHCAYGILTTAGASGTTTASSDGSQKEANWVIALQPEPVVASGRTTQQMMTNMGF
jgi:hypothetical protein